MEKESEPKLYEISYLAKANDEQAALERATFISEIIEKERGIIASQTQPSRKILSYPVKKEVEGWWGFMKFMAKPENISAIKEKIKNDEKILRFSVIKAGKTEAARPYRKRIIKSPPEEKTSIAEIDKKLEEILGG
ncbi:MAG: 30S ribosomal protein S6 [Candidatus Niyogibacteria bacterium]|nr:30S ribosomal protein S6 [Candidatus Niyogibacteria bacterium]